MQHCCTEKKDDRIKDERDTSVRASQRLNTSILCSSFTHPTQRIQLCDRQTPSKTITLSPTERTIQLFARDTPNRATPIATALLRSPFPQSIQDLVKLSRARLY